ncbi:uncharacterized protein PG986_002374 [Apiospora aurea]|uniref:Uncharacterized protein n=1 Tax=Apiospora aurea TaxID=335848 RepID=A0ABR1QZF9_9PEZI
MVSHKGRTWRPVEDPLDRLAVRARPGFQFRRREDMLMPHEAKFRFLEAAQMRFRSMKERSVKLAYGTFYEQLYEEGRCGTLEAESYTCMAVGIERSRHQGHFTEYLILVQIEDDEDLDLLPQLDKEDVDISVSVAYDIPEVPRDCIREDWLIHKVTEFLVSELRSEMSRLGHQRADPSWLKANMMVRILDVYAGPHAGEVDKETFLKGAAEAMSKVYKERDDPYDAQGESWDAWGDKVESFVQEHIQSFKHPPIRLEEDPKLRATRIEVPESLRCIESAMFVATSPQVPDWPAEAGAAPFVPFRLPTLPPGLELASTADMIKQLAKNDKEALARHIFKASIVRAVTDSTMRMELAVISDLTCFPEDASELARLSRYLLNFRGEIETRHITEMFPLLKAVAERAMGAPHQLSSHDNDTEAMWEEFQHLDPDQQAVFSSLNSLPLRDA